MYALDWMSRFHIFSHLSHPTHKVVSSGLQNSQRFGGRIWEEFGEGSELSQDVIAQSLFSVAAISSRGMTLRTLEISWNSGNPPEAPPGRWQSYPTVISLTPKRDCQGREDGEEGKIKQNHPHLDAMAMELS